MPWTDCPTEIIGNVTVEVQECLDSSETGYFWYREALGTVCLLKDSTNRSVWSKTTLITGSVGGAGVDLPS